MFKRIWNLYADGFRHMPKWAKTLLVLIIAKVLIMFLVFKLIFMPNYLNKNYTTEEEKSEFVIKELTTKP